MWRMTLASAVAALLASCGSNNHAVNKPEGDAAVESATLTKLNLTSSAFEDGQPIPAQYSCDGANHSPPLQWGEPPQGTKSFALVIDDPDAPNGTFRHWGAYDIPATARGIGAGQSLGSQATNDNGSIGYTGPCPPKGHGVHHYHFKLFALGVDKLVVPRSPKVADVENAAHQHAVAEGELVGTYERR